MLLLKMLISKVLLIAVILLLAVLILIIIFNYLRKECVHKIVDPSIKNADHINELYYSDYFSFQGEDEQGTALLAIDNNRWKNADGYGLDHFLSMYANNHWIKLEGNKKFKNPSKELITLPDDEVLNFKGSPQSGLVIESSINAFQLNIAPLKLATQSENGFAKFNMLSGPAILTWQGKKIKGRVIEEYLVLPWFSRKPFEWIKLSAGSTFTGLYLSIEGVGDLYLHHKTGKGMNFIGGMDSGFIRLEGFDRPLNQFKMQVTAKKKKWLFSLPMSYNISFPGQNPSMELTLNTISRKDINNFIVAGFSMSAVEGFLKKDGKSYRVRGLGELIE